MIVFSVWDIILMLLLAVVGVIGLYLCFQTVRRQAKCKHTGRINETSACQAICAVCGKNLGFIGNWRKKID